jgi:UPF0288 family protein (methanogenesis marker protein 3)
MDQVLKIKKKGCFMDIEQKADDYIKDEETIQTTSNEENIEKKSSGILDILRSKTGEGSIESYNEHPLNFNNNKYISQIIRGATGIFGALDLAIIDIVMGVFGFITEKKNNV